MQVYVMSSVGCFGRRCYPCYADRSLSFCQTCLNLIRARTANDQLKEVSHHVVVVVVV